MAMKWVLQLLLALEHVHSIDCLVRDLKLDNVLLDGARDVKLADFNHAKMAPVSKAKENSLYALPGTRGYRAPEVYHYESAAYDKNADYFAFAVVLWTLLSGGTCLSE